MLRHATVENNMAKRRTYYTASDDDVKPGSVPQAQEFGRRLHQHMLRKGWRQSELARQAERFLPKGHKFGRHLVSSYVRGVHMPTQLMLEALAKALDVPVANLIPPDSDVSWVGKNDDGLKLTLNGERAHVKFDMDVSSDTALKIAQLLKEDSKRN